jgi:hypothetical protein
MQLEHLLGSRSLLPSRRQQAPLLRRLKPEIGRRGAGKGGRKGGILGGGERKQGLEILLAPHLHLGPTRDWSWRNGDAAGGGRRQAAD